jgi:hypothetical protein
LRTSEITFAGLAELILQSCAVDLCCLVVEIHAVGGVTDELEPSAAKANRTKENIRKEEIKISDWLIKSNLYTALTRGLPQNPQWLLHG